MKLPSSLASAPNPTRADAFGNTGNANTTLTVSIPVVEARSFYRGPRRLLRGHANLPWATPALARRPTLRRPAPRRPCYPPPRCAQISPAPPLCGSNITIVPGQAPEVSRPASPSNIRAIGNSKICVAKKARGLPTAVARELARGVGLTLRTVRPDRACPALRTHCLALHCARCAWPGREPPLDPPHWQAIRKSNTQQKAQQVVFIPPFTDPQGFQVRQAGTPHR